jgi:hypothetical protein
MILFLKITNPYKKHLFKSQGQEICDSFCAINMSAFINLGIYLTL